MLSNVVILEFSENCNVPSPPTNGYLGNYSHTREGATVTFQCNSGYRPSAVFVSTCPETAMWKPAPEELNCIFVTGKECVFLWFNNYSYIVTLF